jgi:16S rRNA (guanine527-N7)-methyltransferase
MIQQWCEKAGIPITTIQANRLERLADLVLAKNQVLNLTSISDRDGMLIKQILNSLYLSKFVDLKPGFRLADLGTGGGFPGLPLAILHPEVHFLLADSVQKKIRAVGEFAGALGLQLVDTVAERIETLGHNAHFRERFDVVTAQALAPLPVLLELALPLVRIGGCFAAFKGPNYQEEIDQSQNAMKALEIGLPKVESYTLPNGAGQRALLIFKKVHPTPSKYPRKPGIPNKSPL